MKRLSTCLFLVLAATAALAAPASAGVQPDGTGEPAYTNTATNTQFFTWTVPQTADAYRIRYRWYKDDVLVKDVTGGAVTGSGSGWVDWAGVTLVEGSKYEICAQGEMSFPGDPVYFADGASSCAMGGILGKGTATTIDRTDPVISVSLAAGAAATRQGTVPLEIGFQDAHAGPRPANFVCVVAGTGSCDSYSYSPACSVPADSSKNTTFGCQVEAAALPDGPVKACVIAADAAVPDNPSTPTQTGSATSANHSDAKCDTIVLDRGAPSLTVAGPAGAQVGQLVEFAAQTGDGGSGVTGAVQWTWGDSTPSGSGSTATHTFTQPGTYQVEATVSDAAGNETVATKTVTVSAPAPGNPAPPQPGEPADPGPSDPGPSDPGAPSPSDPIDPGAKPPVDDPAAGLSEDEIARAAGGGRVARRRIDSLTLLIPKRVRLAKARRALVLGVATDEAGQLEIRLVRKGRGIVRTQKVIPAGAGKQRLRLPRKLRTGLYSLKVSFTKAGADWAASGGAKVRFVR